MWGDGDQSSIHGRKQQRAIFDGMWHTRSKKCLRRHYFLLRNFRALKVFLGSNSSNVDQFLWFFRREAYVAQPRLEMTVASRGARAPVLCRKGLCFGLVNQASPRCLQKKNAWGQKTAGEQAGCLSTYFPPTRL